MLRQLKRMVEQFMFAEHGPPAPTREPVTHNLSMRIWGRNYEIVKFEQHGKFLEIALWATPLPEVGDYLLLRQAEQTTRYRVDKIEPCGDPHDMAFADVSFAPRVIGGAP